MSVSPQEVGRSVASPRSVAWPWLATPLGLLLGVLSVGLNPNPIDTSSSDPSFYLGYALDYGDLAARYGQTYHGNRLSYLLLEMGAFELLGPERGYLALRAVMLAVAAVTVLLVAGPRAGRAFAVVLAVITVSVPLMAQQLFWTHFDGFGAVYALVAAVLLLGSEGRPWRQVLAGAVLGLVVNANLAYLLFVGSLGLAWLTTMRGPLRQRIAGAARVFAGIVATEITLSSVLRMLGAEGPWFIEVVPFRFALRHIGDDTWFTPLAGVLAASPFLILVVLVMVLTWMAGRVQEATRGRDAANLAAAWLGIALSLLLIGHYVFRAGWLGLRAYVVLLAPGVVLALVGVLAVVVSAGRTPRRMVLLSALLWPAPLFLLWSTARPGRWILPLALAGVVVVARALLRPRVVGVRILAATLLPALALPAWGYPIPSRVAEERGRHDSAVVSEWDIFRAIVAVQTIVGAEIPTDRDLLFWHEFGDESGDLLTRVNMVQYGRGTGRLHRDKGEVIGMPDLNGAMVEELRLRAPVTVVLLAWDRRDLLAGIVALTAAVPESRQTLQQVVDGDVLDLHLALIEVG